MVKKWLIWISAFFIFNVYDYKNLGDIFRQGHIRWIFVVLCPLIFSEIKERLHWTLGFYAAYALFSWTINDYPIAGIMSLVVTFGVIAMTTLLIKLDVDVLACMLISFGVFQAIVALGQWFGVHVLFVPNESWGQFLPVGTYGHNTILGPFLTGCLAPALWKRKYLFAALITFVCIISKSTMTIGSLTVVYLLFIWYKTSFKVTLALAFLGIVSLVSGYFLSGGGGLGDRTGGDFYAFNGRAQFWRAGWNAFKEAPYFGGGIGSWVGKYTLKYIGVYQDTLVLQLHNDYLEYLVEYGAVPFTILFGGLVEFIYSFRPTWYHAVCCAILVDAAGNFPFQIASISLLFCVCLVHSMGDHEKIMIQHGGLYG